MSDTILVVDDEQRIIDLARMYLEQDGFCVTSATNGMAAKRMILKDKPNLVVLDLMLPGMDGLEVCRRVRKASDVPIIMLTARDDDIGQDSRAGIGRRRLFDQALQSARTGGAHPGNSAPDGIVGVPMKIARRRSPSAIFIIDAQRRRVEVAGQGVDLRMKEFDLLKSLAENKGVVFSRERLLQVVWGYDFAGETRTVDVHIAHLRHKLGGMDPTIVTVWGVGYKLEDH